MKQTPAAVRVANYKRLEVERQKIIFKLESEQAKEDSFYRDQLQRDLSAIADEIGYWRTCR